MQINLSYSYSKCDICDEENNETYSVHVIQQCCGSLLLLVLAVRIYTLVQLFFFYVSDIFCKF